MPAYPVVDMVDEAGAGDWCTAGIISALGQKGATTFWQTEPQQLEQALMLGQAMAAVNCNFPSARGAMYSIALPDMNSMATGLMEGKLDRNGTELPSNDPWHNLVNMVVAVVAKGTIFDREGRAGVEMIRPTTVLNYGSQHWSQP